MKKFISTTLMLALLTATAFSQTATILPSDSPQDNGWHFGVQLGNCSNNLKSSEGMQTASARFSQNNFHAPNINIDVRYDINKHWMFTSGIGFNAIGFRFSISENHSLLNANKKVSEISTGFAAFEFPVNLFYKLNPNYKNNRWILGAGLVPTFIGKQTEDKNRSVNSENNSTNYLNSHAESSREGSILLRFSVGREKMFRNRSILQANLLVNAGFNTLATSTVNYMLDNQSYSQTFSNNGSSVGFRLAYFFKPVGR